MNKLFVVSIVMMISSAHAQNLDVNKLLEIKEAKVVENQNNSERSIGKDIDKTNNRSPSVLEMYGRSKVRKQ